jgi:hypothetical protein
MRPVALVIAPFKTATNEEKAQTIRAVHHLLAHGWTPVFLPWALDKALDDQRPEQRRIALECSSAFVQTVAMNLRNAAFQVGARVTEGMQRDIADWVSARSAAIEPVRPTLQSLGLAVPARHVRQLSWDAMDRPS